MAKKEKIYTDTTQDIIIRFFEAVEVLIEQKVIRGKQTYCRVAGIDKRTYYRQLKIAKGEVEEQVVWFRVFWLVPLVAEYGISGDWLLSGKGKMQKK